MRFSIFMILILLFAGCEEAPTDKDKADERVKEGWVLFMEKDYRQALVVFAEAFNYVEDYADAYSGLGWTESMRKQYKSAIDYWGKGIISSPEDVDINSGLALVYHATDQFEKCIAAGEIVVKNTDYVFDYNQEVTSSLLHGIMASAYYGLNDFQQAASQMDLADPTNAPHSGTDVESLLNAIMNFLGLD